MPKDPTYPLVTLVIIASLVALSSDTLIAIFTKSFELKWPGADGEVVAESNVPTRIAESEFVWSDQIQDWALRLYETTARDRPEASASCIWPEDSNCDGDRIINQLLLRPTQPIDRFINVALAGDHSTPEGQQAFHECNFNQCQITRNLYEARAIIFRDSDVYALKDWPRLLRERPHDQVWIAYLLESPANTFDKRFIRSTRNGQDPKFNWTATYRSDSELVTPYSKFVPYEDALWKYQKLKQLYSRKLEEPAADVALINNDLGETKRPGKVAWFVSNCFAHNDRLEYARQLSKYIQVDIYGKCGNLTCSKWTQKECLERANSEYKFYLSFENSNSREYITEKLYRNGLGYNDLSHKLLPIVMGPRRADYERFAPPHSFIHVGDFNSPEELAQYLHRLDANEAAYSSYFEWKSLGQFIDTKFMCRVCALLHRSQSNGKTKSYASLRDWWAPD